MAIKTIPISVLGRKPDGMVFDVHKDDARFIMLSDGGKLICTRRRKCESPTSYPPDGDRREDDEFLCKMSGFDDDFSLSTSEPEAGEAFAATDALSWSHTGSLYSIDYTGPDRQPSRVTIDVQSTSSVGPVAAALTCFAAGTMIETDTGLAPVETLSVGDLVKCGDGKARPIRWLSRRVVLAPEMKQHPEYRPVRIRKGAFYDNVPNADMIVSQQHHILINDWRADLLFGEDAVLVPAVHLLNDTDILHDFEAAEVTYYQFMFDHHHTVFSNNLESESFFPCSAAIEGIDDDARDALYRAFPDIKTDSTAYGETCRPTLKAHEALAMVGL